MSSPAASKAVQTRSQDREQSNSESLESCKAEEAEAGQPAAWDVGFARLLQRVKELSTEDLQEILRISRCCVSVASQLNYARHVRTMRLDGAQWASSISLGRANVPILALRASLGRRSLKQFASQVLLTSNLDRVTALASSLEKL